MQLQCIRGILHIRTVEVEVEVREAASPAPVDACLRAIILGPSGRRGARSLTATFMLAAPHRRIRLQQSDGQDSGPATGRLKLLATPVPSVLISLLAW
jgi:hypothetical protein